MFASLSVSATSCPPAGDRGAFSRMLILTVPGIGLGGFFGAGTVLQTMLSLTAFPADSSTPVAIGILESSHFIKAGFWGVSGTCAGWRVGAFLGRLPNA